MPLESGTSDSQASKEQDKGGHRGNSENKMLSPTLQDVDETAKASPEKDANLPFKSEEFKEVSGTSGVYRDI